MFGVKARSLIAVGYVLLIGCGARTESFDEEAGGSTSVAGTAPGAGTSGVPGAGSPNGGGPLVAGAGGASFGGTGAQPAGGFSNGGSFPVAGSFPLGGASGFGAFGGLGFGGAGAEGGASQAGSGGLAEVCGALGASTCEQCVCNQCAGPITGCFSNLGCTLIFACAQQTGCNGLNCYLPNTCRPVIDQFDGLTGASMQHLLSLSICASGATNTCGCN